MLNPELADTLYGRFTDKNASSAQSSQERIGMAFSSLEVLTRKPQGIGIGSQGSANRFSNIDFRINTDNYFFWILLELGLFVSIFFMYYILKQFIVAKKIESDTTIYWSLVLSFLISSMLSSAPTSAIYCINFWVIIFLCDGKINKSN